MTSNRQHLEELQQQAKALAEQIEQLEEQINNTQPTTGLLGRWATNRDGKRVLITADRPSGGRIETAYVADDGEMFERSEWMDNLTFPDQTTRPQDVPVGEAWLVDVDGNRDGVAALKVGHDAWKVADNIGSVNLTWSDEYVTLIAPLIPCLLYTSDAADEL